MATVKIAGDAIIITSALKLEEIKLVAKYNHDALTLYGGEDGKDPIFCLAVSEGGAGELGEYGAVYASATRDEAALATMTLIMNYHGDDVKGFIADELGGPLMHLNALEETLPAVIEQIKADRNTVMESITVA